MRRSLALIAVLTAALSGASGSPAGGPVATLHFRVLAHTGLKLADLAWTGTNVLYLDAVPVPTTLRGGHYNLEGMVYVSP